VFANSALDAIGAGKNTSFCDAPVCELEDDFVGALFDFGQVFAEFDVLAWDEAGHDFEEVFSMCLVNVSSLLHHSGGCT
jgi:hypothetical protein